MHVSSAKQVKPGKQSKPAGKGNRLMRLPYLVIICALSWGGVNFWNQTDRLHDREQKVSALEQKLAEVQQINDDTKREIARLNDKEYIEQKLRKDYGYVKPGETLFFHPKAQK
jgi:cell division protein DivIC